MKLDVMKKRKFILLNYILFFFISILLLRWISWNATWSWDHLQIVCVCVLCICKEICTFAYIFFIIIFFYRKWKQRQLGSWPFLFFFSFFLLYYILFYKCTIKIVVFIIKLHIQGTASKNVEAKKNGKKKTCYIFDSATYKFIFVYI